MTSPSRNSPDVLRRSSSISAAKEVSIIRQLGGGNGEQISKSALLVSLQRFGLAENSPLFAPVRRTLTQLPDLLSESDLKGLKSSHLFLSRALDGELVFPDFERFGATLDKVFDVAATYEQGHVATYIPQLASVNPDQFGAACCSIDGQQWSRGDSSAWFSLQSVSKTITYALVLEEHGADRVHKFIGREPSGAGFNERVLNADGLPHNPLINSGAIMACSLIRPQLHVSHRFDLVMETWTRVCGGQRPQFNNATFLSERDSADRNFCLAYMMREENVFPEGTNLQMTLELYFMLCSIEVTSDMLAVAAATLASGGVCPLTGDRVFSEQTVRNALSVTASCGMYDASGQFCFDIGFPAKSGVAGGLLIVIPGKCGLATFSPRVEGRGNSVRGVRFCEQLALRCDFHQFSIRGAQRQQSLATLAAKAEADITDALRQFRSSESLVDPTTRVQNAKHTPPPSLITRGRTERGRSTRSTASSGGSTGVTPAVVASSASSSSTTAALMPADDMALVRRGGFSERVNSLKPPSLAESNVKAIRQRTQIEQLSFMEKINNELLFATWRNDHDHVRVCVARGADVNYADYDDRTALHVAACEGYDAIVAYLLAHGADRDVKDRYGNVPLDDAVRAGQPVCARLLEHELRYAQVYYANQLLPDAMLETSEQNVPRLFGALDDDAVGWIDTSVIARMLRRVGFDSDHGPHLRALFGELTLLRRVDIGQFARLLAAHPIVRVAVENTNALPNWSSFTQFVGEIFNSLAADQNGKLSPTSETYLRADPNKWALALCSTTGQQLLLGDYDVPFCVDSCGKVVAYLIALELLGADTVHQYVGKEPNGRNFNDLALDKNNRPHNPVINAGSMMIAALIKPDEPMSDRFAYILRVWEKLVGGTRVGFDNETYLARLDKGMRCWTLAFMMIDSAAFPPYIKRGAALNDTLDLFFMMTSLTCTAQQLGIASATLANGGVNPITNERVFKRVHVQNCLSVMSSCGLYDHSGEFVFNVGMPAKSGAAGGLLAVAPKTMGVCTWSPRIDDQGLSIRGAKLMAMLTERFNFHVYDILVRHKEDPTLHNGSQKDDQTADLMFAAAHDDCISVRKVLSLGLDPNVCDYDRRSALHVAAAEGHLALVKLLIEQGASPWLRDRWGATAVDEAKRSGNAELVRLLSAVSDMDDPMALNSLRTSKA